jgi:hypothetical protein
MTDPQPLTLFQRRSTARGAADNRALLRGVIWIFSGVVLAIYLQGLSRTSAHHWSTPRHWPGQTCRLPNPGVSPHPDGHALELRILELRQLGGRNQEIAVLEQEQRELRRLPFSDAFPLVGLVPIGVGVRALRSWLRRCRA